MNNSGKPARTLRRQQTGRHRSGLMVVAALTCLLIVTVIVVNMLQSAIRMRRQLHAQRDLRQTELLLTAGAERAANHLNREPDFSGDTWELPADEIIGREAGRVTTHVTRSDAATTWQIHVAAEYPLDRGPSIRRSQTFDIPTTANPNQE
jgi:hypothetical protein